MTDKVNMLIWFYDDSGRVKSLKLGKFLKSINKRINLGNSAQEFFATEKLALKNKVRLYWKAKKERIVNE
jgi:archaellum biogenesis protein FlaJ (TadC family)